MKTMMILAIGFASLLIPSAFAAPGNPCGNKKLGPACQQICGACQGAGFIVGEAKVGDGFWRDCIQPIMTNTPQPKKAVAAGKALPAAPPSGWAPVVAQCQQTNPGWGTGRGGQK